MKRKTCNNIGKVYVAMFEFVTLSSRIMQRNLFLLCIIYLFKFKRSYYGAVFWLRLYNQLLHTMTEMGPLIVYVNLLLLSIFSVLYQHS